MIKQFCNEELKQLQSDKELWLCIQIYIAYINPLIIILGNPEDKMDYHDFIYYLDDLFSVENMDDNLPMYILTNSEISKIKNDRQDFGTLIKQGKARLEQQEISTQEVQ